MKCILFSFFLATLANTCMAISVYKINVAPEEVQKYIKLVDGSDLDAIQYAPKAGENPLPVAYNEEGAFVYKGREIKSPSDYFEEHYDDHDYHGQDGLGQYLYGYEDWNQAKNEKKDSTGTIRGAYKYIPADGHEMIVKYYADATGFHAEDNRPSNLKNPPTKTPEVRKAEEDHLKLWGEIAAANGHNPDPYAVEYQTKEQSDDSPSGERVYNPQEPKHIQVNDLSGSGEPMGFFYATDFNLPLLRSKEGREKLDRLRETNNMR